MTQINIFFAGPIDYQLHLYITMCLHLHKYVSDKLELSSFLVMYT